MWVADPNFDWGDQLARKYMKYQGKYYDVGTKVRIKTQWNGVQEATFTGWSPSGDAFDCGEIWMGYQYYSYCVEKYIVEIVEPVYPDLQTTTITSNNRECPPSWDVEIGWVWYVIIMAVGVIFKDRWLIWTVTTAIFFLWKNGFLNGGKK